MDRAIRILYVDDSAFDRELVRDVLEQEHGGFEVIEARNREEFDDCLASGAFDLVLSDFNILGFKGFQVLDTVQERAAGTPVIIVTGTGSEEIAVESLKRGAADYVIKTTDHIRRLPLTIQAALKKRRLEEEHRQTFEALQESERRLKALNETLEAQVRQRTVELMKKNDEVRALASALTLAEQSERRRVSRLLHDDLQQLLYGLRVRLHVVSQDISAKTMPELAEHLEYIKQSVARAIDVTRTLSVELNPPVLKGEGLGISLRWLANHIREAYDLAIHLDVRDELRISSEDKRVLLVQLVRELLYNVVKHAQVDEAWVEAYREGGNLVIKVEDEGIGFDTTAAGRQKQRESGLGLFSVEERLRLFGGHLEIESKPGDGSRITIVAPFDEWTQEASRER